MIAEQSHIRPAHRWAPSTSSLITPSLQLAHRFHHLSSLTGSSSFTSSITPAYSWSPSSRFTYRLHHYCSQMGSITQDHSWLHHSGLLTGSIIPPHLWTSPQLIRRLHHSSSLRLHHSCSLMGFISLAHSRAPLFQLAHGFHHSSSLMGSVSPASSWVPSLLLTHELQHSGSLMATALLQVPHKHIL